MAVKDLGAKHVCFKCGTRFYDLKKPEPICPKCGADQRQSPASKPAEKRQRAAPKAVVPVPEVDAEAPEVDAEDDEDKDDDDKDDEDKDDDE